MSSNVNINPVAEGLQAIVTNLSQQADGHMIQSKIFADAGYSKLAKKYADHAAEERGYVEQCVERLIDLGCPVVNAAKPELPVIEDPIDWIRYDRQVSQDGLAALADIVRAAQDDVSTWDILKTYYKDEEDDLYWADTQLALIKKIGEANWLSLQV